MGNQPSIDAEAVQGLTNALTTIARQFPAAPGGGAQPPLPPPSGPPPVPAAPSAPAAAAAPPVPAAPNAPAAAAAPPVPPVPGEGGAPVPPVPFPPMPGPPGYWGPEQPPHEGWLRRCRFCGHQAYWRSGICINERCRVAWLHLVFFVCFFFCVSLFCSTKISYTAEKSGDLNRAKLWGGQEVPREEYVAKVQKKQGQLGSSLFFVPQEGASSPCRVLN